MEEWTGSQMAAIEGHRAHFLERTRITTRRTATSREILHACSESNPRKSIKCGHTAPPCFFHRDCGETAEIEKQGKAVCRPCARGLNGTEYPLRQPSRDPLYLRPEELVLQLEMKESKRKRGGD